MKATIYSVLFASFIAATFARDVPKLMEAFTATVSTPLINSVLSALSVVIP